MADLSHQMGGDLALSPSGDLLAVSGATGTQQRVLRRLLTNASDCIHHLTYGAGLGGMVGQPADALRISAIIRRQMRLERGVGKSPAPAVSVETQTNGTVTATISYADQQTGAAQQLAVTPR